LKLGKKIAAAWKALRDEGPESEGASALAVVPAHSNGILNRMTPSEFLRAVDLDAKSGGASLVNAYAQVWVYSCVSALAGQVAHIPFCISSDPDGEHIIESGPLVDLFRKPHAQLDRFSFWELWVSWMCLRGEVFCVPLDKQGLPTGRGTKPAGLLILDPSKFRHVVQDSELMGWQYTGNSQLPLASQVFLPDEVIHSRLPNPYDFWRGMSPLMVATLPAQTDYAAGQFMKGLMLNNADTGVVVTTEQQPSAEQIEAIKQALKDRKRYAGTADRPLFLWGGSKVEKPTLSSTDMQFLENRKFSRQEICAVFGVPQELLGFTEDANRSVGDAARLNFIENRICPLTERISAAIEPVIQSFGMKAYGFFDVDSLPIMQQARLARIDTAVKVFAMGVPFNDINQQLDLGYPEYPWHKIGYLPFNLQATDGSTSPQPSPQSGEGEDPVQSGLQRITSALDADSARQGPERPVRSALPSAHQCAANPEYEAALAGSIRAKRGRLQRFFFEQHIRVLKAFTDQFGPAKAGTPYQRANDQRLDLIFDLKNENALLKARMKPALVADLEFGGAQVFAELGITDFKLAPEKAVTFLNLREKKIEDINQTTFETLKGSLQEGLEEGATYDELVDRVKEVFDDASQSRAETIATTETNTAVNTGRHEGMKEAKVELKAWKAANLSNVRATHAAAERDYSDGIPLDTPFRVGGYDLMYPADPAGPPQEVINCRCFVVPKFQKAGAQGEQRKLLSWEEWTRRKTARGEPAWPPGT
jgi:HK97 family phage portal protein